MTARQSIGCWCLACLVAGFTLGVFTDAYLRPRCDHYSEVAYNHLDEPLCVLVITTDPRENP
jgi:hypothetical protein